MASSRVTTAAAGFRAESASMCSAAYRGFGLTVDEWDAPAAVLVLVLGVGVAGAHQQHPGQPGQRPYERSDRIPA